MRRRCCLVFLLIAIVVGFVLLVLRLTVWTQDSTTETESVYANTSSSNVSFFADGIDEQVVLNNMAASNNKNVYVLDIGT